jgi:hypothetical protein
MSHDDAVHAANRRLNNFKRGTRLPARTSMPYIFGPSRDGFFVNTRQRPLATIAINYRFHPLDIPQELIAERANALLSDIQAGFAASIRRFLEPFPDHLLELVLNTVAASLITIERSVGMDFLESRLPFGLFPKHILKNFAEPSPFDADRFLQGYALVHHAAMSCALHRNCVPACDRELPQFQALTRDFHAIELFISKGGRFDDEGRGLQFGLTFAHVAVQSTARDPRILIAFLENGGAFHDRLDDYGNTPLLLLLANAIEPDVVIQAAHIAGRTFTRVDIEHTNVFGFSALSHARTRGVAFEAALSAISVEGAA